MPNINNIISSHNKAVLNEETHRNNTALAKECNCRQKNTCPLNGKCHAEGIVYQATVTREDDKELETYVGLTETKYKTRYLNHTSSFRNEKRKSSTELSKYIRALKETDVNFSIKWNIMKQCKPYSNKTKRCNLCLYEKFIIICHPELSSLNTRNELISTLYKLSSLITHNTSTHTVTHIHIHNISTHPFYCHDVTHTNYSL